jgi:hypothetical protein
MLASFFAAGFALVEEGGGSLNDQIGGFGLGKGTRYGELDALVLSDGALKDDSFTRISAGFVDEPAGIANTFGGDQETFGVHAR